MFSSPITTPSVTYRRQTPYSPTSRTPKCSIGQVGNITHLHVPSDSPIIIRSRQSWFIYFLYWYIERKFHYQYHIFKNEHHLFEIMNTTTFTTQNTTDWLYTPSYGFVNLVGNLVDIDVTSTKEVMKATIPLLGTQMTASLVDYPFPDAYPFTSYSYFIIHMAEMYDCEIAIELVRYILWILDDESAQDQALDFKMSQVKH